MNYEQTIDYLYDQLPMFSRIGPAAYKKGLDNIIHLCKLLGDPHLKFKTIHIAGTNGKGSTSHTLAAILQESGYKTGLYTSPHIKDFRERIRIDGEMINEQAVIEFVEKVKDADIQPSFFEITVALAFGYFAREKVDIAVIETGLGGRLDSTNIITPLLSVITNIGYDHMQLLGNTLPEIAAEKAGIIKENIPVVIGETHEETKNVFIKKAMEMHSDIHFAENEFMVEYIESDRNLLLCNVKDLASGTVEKLKLDAQGVYQAKNACTVLCTVKMLQSLGMNIPNASVLSGFSLVKKLTGLKGRWDIIHDHPTIILDVAHNIDGINQVLQQLRRNYQSSVLHFVLGFVKDKALNDILALFPKKANYYFSSAHIPRALPHNELKAQAESFSLIGESFDDVNDALKAARKNAGKNDVIMVCGSFFIIGELR
jgi:dihydrofolate synthase / folylpolyglutamate synthase